MTNFNYITIPPYTPEFAPIENLFGIIKKKIRKHVYNDEKTFLNSVKLVINDID